MNHKMYNVVIVITKMLGRTCIHIYEVLDAILSTVGSETLFLRDNFICWG
jgi:hypothetical protein